MADELGAEPQVGDGNDDQGDEERQPSDSSGRSGLAGQA